MEIWKEFTFEAAHLLPNVPEGHKCRRLHGHSYRVRVYVSGEPDAQLGWVMDFADIKRAYGPIREELDHRFLNEIAGLENSTAEVIAAWIWERLQPRLPDLSRIEIGETCTSGCIYEGPDSA
jgi:6-pyruvoyltetrahydropterin/6-carboxytetrahydropterin synthase